MKDIIFSAVAGTTVALAGAAAGALVTLSLLGSGGGDTFEPINVGSISEDETAQWCYPGSTNPDPALRHGSWDCYETEQEGRRSTAGSTLYCYENVNRTGWDCKSAKQEPTSEIMDDTVPMPVAPEELTAEVLARLMPPPAGQVS